MVAVLDRAPGFLSVVTSEGGLLSQALATDGLLTLYASASCSTPLECGGH